MITILFTLSFLLICPNVFAEQLYQFGEKVCYQDIAHSPQWEIGTVRSYENGTYVIYSELLEKEYTVGEMYVWKFEYEPEVGDLVLASNPHGSVLCSIGRVVDKRNGEYKIQRIQDDDPDGAFWAGPCYVFPLPKEGDYIWTRGYYGLSGDTRKAQIEEANIEENSWSFKVRYLATDPPEYEEVWWIWPMSPLQVEKLAKPLAALDPMKVPSGKFYYKFPPRATPLIHSDPAAAQPIGVGLAAFGGKRLTLEVGLPAFTDQVDMYLAVYHDSLPEPLLFDYYGNLVPLSQGPKRFSDAFTSESRLERTFVDNLDISTLPEGDYHLYLVVTPFFSTDFSSYYMWETWFTVTKGTPEPIFGGAPLSQDEIDRSIQDIIRQIEEKAGDHWKQLVYDYINSSNDTLQALGTIAFAGFFSNKLELFCWASLKAFEISPDDPFVLNSAAVCLIELGMKDLASALLDKANEKDPSFSVTYENAAFLERIRGDDQKALYFKSEALRRWPKNPHDAWDAYNYGVFKGIQNIDLDQFRQHIPINYSLKNIDDSPGMDESYYTVCCPCTGKIYHDVIDCLDECPVTLKCFTHICTPHLHCCRNASPFDVTFNFEVCYPPTGAVSVCVGVDSSGKINLKAEAKIAEIINASINLQAGFNSDDYTIYIQAGAGAEGAEAAAQLVIFTTDPKERIGASKYSVGYKASYFGISVGINLTGAELWEDNLFCEMGGI